MSQRVNSLLIHRLYSLYLFAHHKFLGRYRLADFLGMTKDQTRAVIDFLVISGYLETKSQRIGHTLTAYGQEFIQKCQQYLIIPFIPVHFGSEFTIGTKDAVVCMEVSEIGQLNTVIMRDESLLAGASGCTIFLQTANKEVFLLNVVYPPLPETPLRSRKVRSRIDRITNDTPWNETIIIVGSAATRRFAMRGALASSLLLFPDALKEQLLPED